MPIFLPLGFLLAAVIYSMVGMGGASSYLALLSFTGMSAFKMSTIALSCNLVVAGSGWFRFSQAGHFKWSILLPFLVFSIPAAFWGGSIQINEATYRLVLGVLLLISIPLLIIERKTMEQHRVRLGINHWVFAAFWGSSIGLVSGLVGIGGGIILVPILILFSFCKTKQAMAAGAAFIFINSIAGLVAKLQHGALAGTEIFFLALAALLGAQWGASWGSKKIAEPVLKNILAAMMLLAALRLIRDGLKLT
jgi:uncharacterized membrane protein YfcA